MPCKWIVQDQRTRLVIDEVHPAIIVLCDEAVSRRAGEHVQALLDLVPMRQHVVTTVVAVDLNVEPAEIRVGFSDSAEDRHQEISWHAIGLQHVIPIVILVF